MAKKKTTATAVKKRSVEQLVGIIATKDQALSEQSIEIGKLKGYLEGVRESESELLEVVVSKKKVIQDLEQRLAKAEKAIEKDKKAGNETLPGNSNGDQLENAVNVLRGEGFTVYTDAKITDCREEDGARHRSFRHRGRYEPHPRHNRYTKGK